MLSQLDQEAADVINAMHRWLALQLEKMQALLGTAAPQAGKELDEYLQKFEPNLQTALSLMHLYQEALRAAQAQHQNAGGAAVRA